MNAPFYRVSQVGPVQVLTVLNLLNEYANQQIILAAQSLIDSGHYRFVVDLSEIQVMNSVGLNFLITLRSRSADHGGNVILCNASPRVKQLLEVTKLHTIFQTAGSVAEGVALLR